jgi:hypothetical protein
VDRRILRSGGGLQSLEDGVCSGACLAGGGQVSFDKRGNGCASVSSIHWSEMRSGSSDPAASARARKYQDASDHRTLTVRLAPLPGDCRGTGVIEALDALGPAVGNDILCALT